MSFALNNCNYCLHFLFIQNFCSYFFSFQELAKEALALYESTIFELNITIKIASETAELLQVFADNVESWRFTCWKTIFFKLFKSNDDIMKNNFFYKQHRGLQAMRRVV